MADMEIKTDYFTIIVDDDGRGFNFQINPGIKASPHRKALTHYVNVLRKEGVTRLNADHINLPWLDRSIKLNRGRRRLDVAYYKDGLFYECELKPKHDCGLDRTYIQAKEQAQYCERLTLLVPHDMMQYVSSNLKLRNINNVSVDTYEI